MRNYLLLIFLFISLFAHNQHLSRISPINKYVTADTVITFQWNKDSVLLSNYELRIYTDSLCSNLFLSQNNLSIPVLTVSGLNNCSEYYWIYRSNRGGSFSNWSDTNRLSIFSPLCIDSLALWLDPKIGISFDSLGRVSSWISRGNNPFNFIQSTNNSKPIFKDSSRIYFDGANKFLTCSSPIQFKSGFSVFNWTGSSTFNDLNTVLCQNTNATNPRIVFIGATGTTDLYANSSFSAFNTNIYVNGNSTLSFLPMTTTKIVYGFTQTTVNFSDILIGRLHTSSTRCWFGNIYDIILLKKIPNSNEINKINSFLRNSISKPVSLGEDIIINYYLCDTVIKTNQKFNSYLWSNGSSDSTIHINKEGKYWVRVTDIFGRVQSDTLLVYDRRSKLKMLDTIICLNTTTFISSNFDNRYNFLWSNASTNDSLITDQPGDYWVKVSDTLGCYIMDTVHVYVDSFAVEASLGVDKNVCTGEKISLETANNKAVNYLWSDNTSDSLLTINAAGTYSLAVSDIHGCLAKDTIYVSIHGFTPTVGFSTDSVCHTQSMLFQDTSSTPDASNIIQWEWDFGDGSSPIIKTTNQLISHLYPDTGNFTIRLKVTTDSACANYVYKNSYVKPLPKPFFSPNQVCLNEEIHFNNLSVSDFGTITAYRWLFGDGDSSAFPQPKHQYAISGNKSVKLIATTEYNCVDSTLLIVKVKDVPEVKFSSDTICFGKTTSFVDQSTSILSNPIYQRMWYFSPYDSSQLINPQFWFNAPGSFPVKLRVKAMNGCSDTLVKNVYVASLPKANFILPTFCYGATHTILDSSFVTADQVQRYIWSIDSTPYSTSQNIELSFKDTLYHKAKLWISTNQNCTDTISKSFKVHSIPKPAFTYDKEYGLPPLLVNFYNQSQNADNYIWNFGDGSALVSQASIQTIAHVYTDSAIMEPILYAIDLNNCSDSSKGLINVVYIKTDLSMEAIEAKLNGNYITFTCVVKNTGKQKIKKIDFKANYNGQFPMLESWEGMLMPNQSMDYTFKAKAYASSPEEIKYYCFRANISGDQTDENPKNDELCKEYNVSYWLGSPYPNPVYDKLSLDLILDDPADCSISISDINGKIIWTTTAYFIKGLNQYNVSTANLPAGQYYLKLKFDDKEEVRVFVK